MLVWKFWIIKLKNVDAFKPPEILMKLRVVLFLYVYWNIFNVVLFLKVYYIQWEHQKHFHFLSIQDYKKIQLYVAILLFILPLTLNVKTEHPFLLATGMTLHKSCRKALYAGNDMVKNVLRPFYIIFPSVSLWSDPEFYYENPVANQLPFVNYHHWLLFVRGIDI